MKKVYKISIAVVAILLVGVFAIDSVVAAKPEYTLNVSEKNSELVNVRELNSYQRLTDDLDKVKELVPETYEEAEAKIITVKRRFLLWTQDGVHIMWGRCGNGLFVGTDNAGVHAWGIYSNTYFAGFYGEQFFQGRFRNGHWKAVGLFGESQTHGEYILFRGIKPVEAVPESLQ